jgi:hypothetical protein
MQRRFPSKIQDLIIKQTFVPPTLGVFRGVVVMRKKARSGSLCVLIRNAGGFFDVFFPWGIKGVKAGQLIYFVATLVSRNLGGLPTRICQGRIISRVQYHTIIETVKDQFPEIKPSEK